MSETKMKETMKEVAPITTTTTTTTTTATTTATNVITADDVDVRAKFVDLCRELNMDKETEEMSWMKFLDVQQRFNLEGDPVHWFCCALYAACRESYTPTVGAANAVVMGNCVSLNKLLRSCNISIYQFLSKIKNWHEMANMSSEFLNQIDKLERTFSITFHLFQRYNTIFEQIFLVPRNEKRNHKFRSATKCSSSKLYDVCWCLYLCVKNENQDNTVDIITSFHLLLCCIDLIYVNVLTEKRVDLINPEFSGVPDGWNTSEFDVNTIKNYCIIEPLCKLTQAILGDAQTLKKNSWRSIIKTFFHTNTLHGNSETFLDLLSNQNFEKNAKSLNSAYEQFVLSVGEFDERILLNNPNYRKLNSTDEKDGSKMEPHHQEVKSLIPNTPYTRKHFLPSKEVVNEPVANATTNVQKLLDISYIVEPSEFIRKAGDACVKKVTDKLKLMFEKFEANYPNSSDASTRFQLAKSLYYYLLERIIRVEIRTKPNIDLKILLDTDIFNTTLIACCVEIVLDAYNSQQKFPWILNCFSINAFHFYKIIEIVVGRHDGILTRTLIKHLNAIEETCLESMVWQKTSPVWEIIRVVSSPLPTWSEVDVSNTMKQTESSQVQSPMNSAYETFNSTPPVTESARRDLFNAQKDGNNEKPFEPLKKQENSGNKRAGSLPIFLRKFYKLAWLRIKELCNELDMGNELFLNKIWTLFEYSITQRTQLMQDRHLDQILMCAIYLYIKVGEIHNKSFTDIMKFYRKQPQALSSTYREVLIDLIADPNNPNADLIPKYGDIINFYNNIYVQKMTPYALNFSEKKKSQHDLLLSPHPTEKQSVPRKLSNNHLLYIYPLEKNEVLHSPNPISYEFNKSPAKQLGKMNEIVRRGKRNLPFNDDSSIIENKIARDTPRIYKTIRGIIKDRQEEKK